MIRYYCDGSFREDLNTVGCGIIRRDKDNAESFFLSTQENMWFQYHEAFAVYQTLLVIEKKQDKNTTIYNDDMQVVFAVRYHKTENHTYSKKAFKNIGIILRKIEELNRKGYSIQIEYKNDKQSRFAQMAHACSRSYLTSEKKQKEKERQEKQLQKEIERKISIQKGLPCNEMRKREKIKEQKPQLTIEEREVLRNKSIEAGANEVINTKVLLNSKQIYFEKVSGKKWCVFNEQDTPIYLNRNLAHIIYDVIQETLKHKKEVKIKKSSRKIFGSAVKSRCAQIQYPEIYSLMEQWEEENRIQFVS